MSRAIVCGAALAPVAAALGLERVAEAGDLVLVDMSDPAAVVEAAAIPSGIPRVIVVDAGQELLLRAAGAAAALTRSSEPAAIGALVAAVAPARIRPATRLIVVTSAEGGNGCTLLVTNLARRLAHHSTVAVLDATGSGAAGWWLRLAPSPWSDLEGLVGELGPEHLAVVAAEREGLRLLGGSGRMPSLPLLTAAARAAASLADLVIVDAPTLGDERTGAMRELAERTIVLADPHRPSAAVLEGVAADEAWLVASRCADLTIHGRTALRWLPDDAGAIRRAAAGPDQVEGALGRAYDDLAELVALDTE